MHSPPSKYFKGPSFQPSPSFASLPFFFLGGCGGEAAALQPLLRAPPPLEPEVGSPTFRTPGLVSESADAQCMAGARRRPSGTAGAVLCCCSPWALASCSFFLFRASDGHTSETKLPERTREFMRSRRVSQSYTQSLAERTKLRPPGPPRRFSACAARCPDEGGAQPASTLPLQLSLHIPASAYSID